MSEYPPITQELRKLIDGQNVNASISKAAHHRAMEHCDAIDAFHKNLEDENARLFAEVQRLTREREQAKASDEQYDMRREFDEWKHDRDTNWMKLPVDADGEVIHIEDMMERGEARGRVIALMLSNYPKKWGGTLHWGIQLEGEHAPTALDLTYHHYHKPTLEDVLREYTEHLCELCTTEYACDTTREELLRQYADRLRALGGE